MAGRITPPRKDETFLIEQFIIKEITDRLAAMPRQGRINNANTIEIPPIVTEDFTSRLKVLDREIKLIERERHQQQDLMML